MLDTTVPKKITYFFDLIRLNKPIGFLLLMWPCWFALAYLDFKISETVNWFVYFFLGSFLMRSSGCIINDLIDINLDKKIDRTSKRPLTSKKISIVEALVLLIILLALSLCILLQFNFNSILIGVISVPLIIIYPFLKRFTHWPQLGLGIVFNWGILIVSIQFLDKISLDYLILYFGCIFWTLAYDTIYAYQDIKDDLKNNIKSTAVLFKEKGKKYVFLFYSVFFISIGFLGYRSSESFLSLIVIIVLIFVIGIYLNKWKINSVESSNYYFRYNNAIGSIFFIYLLVF